MSYWGGMRWSSAWLFIPLIIVSTYSAAISELDYFGNYPLVASSQPWVSMITVAPLLAGWGAWDAGRLRAWLDLHSSGRGYRARAIQRALAPAMFAGAALVTATVSFVAGSPGSLLEWSVYATATITMLAFAAAGIAIGLTAPRIAACPVAVAVAYAAMALPVIDPAQWPGQVTLTGIVAPCCSSNEQINPQTLVAACLVALLITAGATLSITLLSGRTARSITLATSFALSAVLAAVLGVTLGERAQVEARSTSLSCQIQSGLKICVWPENASHLSQVHYKINTAINATKSLGVDLPRHWSQRPERGAAYFVWSDESSGEEHSYALGIDIAHRLGCRHPDDELITASYIARQMGVSPSALIARNPDMSATIVQFDDLSSTGRRATFSRQIAGCSP